MGFLQLSAAALAFLASYASAAPVLTAAESSLLTERDASIDMPLRAISRASKKRDQVNNLLMRSSVIDLDYVDEETLVDGKPFVGTVAFGPSKPALALEHIDGLLSGVKCSSAGILLKFAAGPHLARAREAWTEREFIVITSHDGCNKDGERVPYMVSGFSFNNHRNLAMLSAKPLSWESAASTLEVSFGYRDSHEGLHVGSYKPSPSMIARRDATQDLSFSHIGEAIVTINGVVTQKCARCVGTGTVTISEGKVSLKNEVQGIFGAIGGALTGGGKPSVASMADAAEVNIVFKNFAAEFQFETDIQIKKDFTFHLLKGPVGIPGFSIAGLFSLGPSFDPLLVASIKLFQPIGFTYGFNMSIPDGSGYTIDMVDSSKSKKLGFEGPQFTALPFELVKFTPGLNVSISFVPKIELGISILTAQLDPIAVTSSVPRFEVGLVPFSNVDSNCNPLPAGQTSGEALRVSSDFVFDLSIGADFQITDTIAFSPSVTLAKATLFPLQTCLAFGAGGLPAPGGAPAALVAASLNGTNSTGNGTALHRRRNLPVRNLPIRLL